MNKNLLKFTLNLKTLRGMRSLTQQEVADSLNLSIRSYQRIELGESEPTLSTLYNLAALFEITIQKLLCFKDDELFFYESVNEVDVINYENSSNFLNLSKKLIKDFENSSNNNFLNFISSRDEFTCNDFGMTAFDYVDQIYSHSYFSPVFTNDEIAEYKLLKKVPLGYYTSELKSLSTVNDVIDNFDLNNKIFRTYPLYYEIKDKTIVYKHIVTTYVVDNKPYGLSYPADWEVL